MDFFDQFESQDPESREARLMAAIPTMLHNARDKGGAYVEKLEGIDPAAIVTREALAAIPVTRKSELLELQKAKRPFGGFFTGAYGEIGRVFQSPGPIYEPEGRKTDYWRTARALFAAGFRGGELVHNTFSYHFTPAGFMLEGGAHALGCAVFPAGVGQTEMQVSAIADLKPSAYVGTPSFLKIILEKATEMGVDISSINKGLVSGEPLPPSLRKALVEAGVSVLQCYATADVGLISYESEAQEGMIVDEEVILEIVRPGTGDPVEEGEVGEVVVTALNYEYPLIRFGTGDLSAILPGISPCGRTNTRIKGWMGRADQTTKVKGMFVHPSQIAEVLKRHPEITKARLVVDRDDANDIMELHCESTAHTDQLAEGIVQTIRDVCKLRGGVKFAVENSLPNDGKVIDDVRTYE